MATIVLSAVGASLGAGFGGSLLGLSGAVLGRAAGATMGRVIDQRLLGPGSQAVETGRIDRLRLQTAGEGAPIARMWGQMRLPGHVIWAGPLNEDLKTHGGGKGTMATTEFSYRLSFALALCEGVIGGVGRVWADGEEVAPDDLGMRVYHGAEDQIADPAIVAQEGENAPAYRGTAYVLFEELALGRWGNRVPQFTFEVTRQAEDGTGYAENVQGVALMPGTGEFTLATTRVDHDLGLGERSAINVNTPSGHSDFQTSLDTLGRELPKVGSVSLIVSWFGDDLRAGMCRVRPCVEDETRNVRGMEWRAGGIPRDEAEAVARRDGRPVYGGTPADQSVVEALRAISLSGRRAMFYPFILMDQQPGNGLADPSSGNDDQPVMPWRGRITTEIGAGRLGSSDGTIDARAEVDAFFGDAQVDDFTADDATVSYHGAPLWGYRRFILHYAHLCAVAGGVDSFLIGSEMRGLTWIRDDVGYPAVDQLIRLAGEVRGILGPDVKIGYAADWSEYSGHRVDGDLMFHLDKLWADPAIDFIGIDNYMPLSDWRDGEDHTDSAVGSIYNLDYLRSNVEGGEGYDWYYADPAHREAQRRTPITDGLGEAWVWRVKDIRSWWSNPHHNRIGGVRDVHPTAWVPGSKPIWFTELGCAALDKGTNQPNKFLDAYSSESQLPHYSNGRRDDAVQEAYLHAVTSYWADPTNNPPRADGGRMIDLERAHVWAWDARPYPAFPARLDLWSDGPAWERGHWLNGRAGGVPLRDVVSELCKGAGVARIDTSELVGVVRGFALQQGESARSAMQILMLVYGFDAIERGGRLVFRMRDGRVNATLDPDQLAVAEGTAAAKFQRAAEPELAGRVRLSHIEAGGDYTVATVETMLPEDDRSQITSSEFAISLTRPEARAVAERWLAESRVARDTARFALPPSLGDLGAGDVVELPAGEGRPARWRIDRVELSEVGQVEAVRVEPGIYKPAEIVDGLATQKQFVAPTPVWPVFLDLPLIEGDEVPHAPYLAVTATPWTGSAALWMSPAAEGGYQFVDTLPRPAVMGRTMAPLRPARSGVVDRGPALRVEVKGGDLASITEAEMLAGGNFMAIGDGSPDGWELFQFATATPAGNRIWDLSLRLRGQAGTDAMMPDVWPSGSIVVLLDRAVAQVPLKPAARDQMRWWRVGPALRSPDDPSYHEVAIALSGIGLRPLSPAHLCQAGRVFSWIRRSRLEADNWSGTDAPLGEERESYEIRVIRGEDELWRGTVDAPRWEVPGALWGEWRSGGDFVVTVAQLSATFGSGLPTRKTVNV